MRRWLPLLAVCLGTFMLLLDVTIVNVALPDMAADLRASFTDLQWVVNGYALVLAALLLAIGSAADLLGRRRTYLGGLALFALASLACALASAPGALIAARAVQGIGGAAMFATTLALLGDSYQGRDRGTAFATWGAVSGLAAAAGPLLGGVLTELASWRWIFVVNLPISLAAVALTVAVVPGARPDHGARVDVAGALAFTLAAGGLTYGLVESSELGWSAGRVLGAFVLAAVSLAAFLVAERRVAHPLLDLSLLRSRAFVATLVAAAVLSAAAFSALTFSSLWLQSVRHTSAITTGLLLAPLSAAALVVSASVGRAVQSAPPRLVLPGGLMLIATGSLAQTVLGATGSTWWLAPGLVVVGLGTGLVAPTVASAAVAAVPPARAGMAAGAVNTARQLGLAVGVAVLAATYAHRVGPSPESAAAALRAVLLLGAGLGAAGAATVAILTWLPASAPVGEDPAEVPG